MSIQDDFLTIILKKTGRILSFNVTTAKCVIALAIVLLMNVVLVFFMFQYGTLQYKKVQLVKEITGMKGDIAQMREEIKEAVYYKKWADGII